VKIARRCRHVSPDDAWRLSLPQAWIAYHPLLARAGIRVEDVTSRRVLVLAYHFPPIGYSGTQRTTKFVRYLPRFGFEPVVVTGPGDPESNGLPLDRSLAAELPDELEVHRVRGPEPAASGGWRGRGERWLRLSRPWQRWWIEGSAEAAIAAGRHARLLFASMSPFESAFSTERAARVLGVPWIADLRDPWALDEMLVYPSRAHRALEVRRMRAGLGTAAAIVMNTPEAAAQLTRAFPELGDRPVLAITNGFDADDFSGPPPTRADDVFRIVHTGSFHTAAGSRRGTRRARALLGGSIGGVDFLPRSHVFLLEAVDRALAERPELAGRVEVHLAGTLSDQDRGFTRDYVRVHGYLDHLSSVALVRSADLLFLPLHDVEPGFRTRIVPGKTYEYLAARRPVLAAAPSGDAADLVWASGIGSVCPPTDVSCLAREILAAVERTESGGSPLVPDESVIERYDRLRLTEELAGLFDDVLSRS
jgi:glycosyltransferase involved in cell wall biosynthesis